MPVTYARRGAHFEQGNLYKNLDVFHPMCSKLRLYSLHEETMQRCMHQDLLNLGNRMELGQEQKFQMVAYILSLP